MAPNDPNTMAVQNTNHSFSAQISMGEVQNFQNPELLEFQT